MGVFHGLAQINEGRIIMLVSRGGGGGGEPGSKASVMHVQYRICDETPNLYYHIL